MVGGDEDLPLQPVANAHLLARELGQLHPGARWCRTASSCRGRAACASSRCLRPRKQRWSDCRGWCGTGCCACWRKEGPCPRKGPRTRCRHTRRTPCNSGSGGRRWMCLYEVPDTFYSRHLPGQLHPSVGTGMKTMPSRPRR
jgi:hypothetical protein